MTQWFFPPSGRCPTSSIAIEKQYKFIAFFWEEWDENYDGHTPDLWGGKMNQLCTGSAAVIFFLAQYTGLTICHHPPIHAGHTHTSRPSHPSLFLFACLFQTQKSEKKKARRQSNGAKSFLFSQKNKADLRWEARRRARPVLGPGGAIN